MELQPSLALAVTKRRCRGPSKLSSSAWYWLCRWVLCGFILPMVLLMLQKCFEGHLSDGGGSVFHDKCFLFVSWSWAAFSLLLWMHCFQLLFLITIFVGVWDQKRHVFNLLAIHSTGPRLDQLKEDSSSHPFSGSLEEGTCSFHPHLQVSFIFHSLCDFMQCILSQQIIAVQYVWGKCGHCETNYSICGWTTKEHCTFWLAAVMAMVPLALLGGVACAIRAATTQDLSPQEPKHGCCCGEAVFNGMNYGLIYLIIFVHLSFFILYQFPEQVLSLVC